MISDYYIRAVSDDDRFNLYINLMSLVSPPVLKRFVDIAAERKSSLMFYLFKKCCKNGSVFVVILSSVCTPSITIVCPC